MLSQELRPFSLDEMAGQKENIKIVKAILKNPEQAPRVLIFSGAFGSGKTTMSRILARELNNIKDRDFNILDSPYYYEFDSTVIGNIDTIRNLRDEFTVSYGDYWRIITLDECHAISNAAQNALLKMFEEAQGKNMFILATTEVNKLLPTIRSRALELTFNKVPREEIIKNLTGVCSERDISITDDIKMLIADRSDGHMRNAHMLLDKYILLGTEDFKDSVKSAITLYCDYLIAIHKGDKDKILENINELMNIPKDNLQNDWNTVMTESMKGYCGFEVRHDDIKRLMAEYKSDFQLVTRCFMSDWIRNAFLDMPYFQATFLNLYLVLTNALNRNNGQSSQSTQQVSNGRPLGRVRS